MPNRSDLPLNQDVLARMAAGRPPAEAVATVAAENPQADAGLIAIGMDGRVGSADMGRLERLSDRGCARLGSRDRGLAVVRHNAIHPFRGLALIVAELVLLQMVGQAKPQRPSMAGA